MGASQECYMHSVICYIRFVLVYLSVKFEQTIYNVLKNFSIFVDSLSLRKANIIFYVSMQNFV